MLALLCNRLRSHLEHRPAKQVHIYHPGRAWSRGHKPSPTITAHHPPHYFYPSSRRGISCTARLQATQAAPQAAGRRFVFTRYGRSFSHLPGGSTSRCPLARATDKVVRAQIVESSRGCHSTIRSACYSSLPSTIRCSLCQAWWAEFRYLRARSDRSAYVRHGEGRVGER